MGERIFGEKFPVATLSDRKFCRPKAGSRRIWPEPEISKIRLSLNAFDQKEDAKCFSMVGRNFERYSGYCCAAAEVLFAETVC